MTPALTRLLEEVRMRASAATPGPYALSEPSVDKKTGIARIVVRQPDAGGLMIGLFEENTALYVHRLDPPTTLALVNIIERAVAALEDVTQYIDVGERDGINAPEDPFIKDICERLGYGAVIDSAARQWRKIDPIGAITSGPCVYVVKNARTCLGDIEAEIAKVSG